MSYPRRSVAGLTLGVPGAILAGGVAVGVALAVPAVGLLRQGWQLDIAGVDGTGRVTRLWTDSHSCNLGDPQTCQTDWVAYAFQAEEGPQQAQASVSGGLFDRLAVGQDLPVRYVAGQPGISEVEAGTTFIGAVALALLALGFVGAGAAGLAIRWRRARRMVALRERGIRRRAEVTALLPANMRVMGQSQGRITWRDSAGVDGRSRMQRQDRLPAPGSAIEVYADPEGRLPPVWDGDSGSR